MTELKAGRELDIEIGTKVMGWKHKRIADPFLYGFHSQEEKERLYDIMETKTDGAFTAVSEVPKFSTDIAAAWMVVEKVMHEKPAAFHVDRDFETGEPYGPSGYRVFLGGGGVWALTVPLGICLAALKAVE